MRNLNARMSALLNVAGSAVTQMRSPKAGSILVVQLVKDSVNTKPLSRYTWMLSTLVLIGFFGLVGCGLTSGSAGTGDTGGKGKGKGGKGGGGGAVPVVVATV